MKPNLLNKDNNFSLSNLENYKKDFDCDINKISNKYLQLIIEYFNFIRDSIKVKNNSFAKFIIIRGLDTITHVFNYILYSTKNLDLTYYHCQKSFYFYIEFVGQITEDDKMFLQLTTRDASTYVYKKTIFDINNEFKKINENTTKEFREKIEIISNYIKLYQTYFLKIIDKNDSVCINYIIDISQHLNSLNKKIEYLEKITDTLYYKIDNITIFFQINKLIVEKLIKNTEILNKTNNKLNLEIFDKKLEDSNDNFVNWLLS